MCRHCQSCLPVKELPDMPQRDIRCTAVTTYCFKWHDHDGIIRAKHIRGKLVDEWIDKLLPKIQGGRQ